MGNLGNFDANNACKGLDVFGHLVGLECFGRGISWPLGMLVIVWQVV